MVHCASSSPMITRHFSLLLIFFTVKHGNNQFLVFTPGLGKYRGIYPQNKHLSTEYIPFYITGYL